MMKYQNENLSKEKMNETVTGLKNSYKCWSSAGALARKYMEDGKDLICLASEPTVIDNNIVRKYIYIGFHKTLEDFFQKYKDEKDLYYYFIPVGPDDNADAIIEDIKAAKLNPYSTI